MNHAELMDALETIVDKTTLSAVLRALSEVCYAKRDHLLEAWQDKEQAKDWGRAAAMLDRIETRIEV